MLFIKCESRFTLVPKRKLRKAYLGHSRYPTGPRAMQDKKSVFFRADLGMNRVKLNIRSFIVLKFLSSNPVQRRKGNFTVLRNPFQNLGK